MTTGILTISHVLEDAETGRSAQDLKFGPRYSNSPLELAHRGFVGFRRAAERLRTGDADARLFPLLTSLGRAAASARRGRNGSAATPRARITNRDRVFHSFSTRVQRCLCARPRVSEDVNDALTGHAGGNSVARGYGAKDMIRRFGLPPLANAVKKVAYPGLDLSRIKSHC